MLSFVQRKAKVGQFVRDKMAYRHSRKRIKRKTRKGSNPFLIHLFAPFCCLGKDFTFVAVFFPETHDGRHGEETIQVIFLPHLKNNKVWKK